MTPSLPIINESEWTSRMRQKRADLADTLYAMYSGLTGAITTDPALMTVPIDDHLTHRGDGVFESLKCINGSLYNVDAHLTRLERSCQGISLTMPETTESLKQIICDTIRAGNRKDCLVRVLVSRGAGNMGIDPSQCNGPILYIVVYRLTTRPDRDTIKPVRAAISTVPIKPKQFATIKTCNYLPNALMKLEANQRGLDFVISVDENNNLGEGATENIGIVTQNDELLMPTTERILSGTTARRALDLAQKLVADNTLRAAEYRDIPINQIPHAKEILIFGTTTDVTPVIEWEGKPVGNGTPGPIAKKLLHLLNNDMTPKSDTLTPVFPQPQPQSQSQSQSQS